MKSIGKEKIQTQFNFKKREVNKFQKKMKQPICEFMTAITEGFLEDNIDRINERKVKYKVKPLFNRYLSSAEFQQVELEKQSALIQGTWSNIQLMNKIDLCMKRKEEEKKRKAQVNWAKIGGVKKILKSFSQMKNARRNKDGGGFYHLTQLSGLGFGNQKFSINHNSQMKFGVSSKDPKFDTVLAELEPGDERAVPRLEIVDINTLKNFDDDGNPIDPIAAHQQASRRKRQKEGVIDV